MDAINLRRMNKGKKRPLRKIEKRELYKKSLEMLKDYKIHTAWDGVTVMFKPLSFSLSETETKALIEFGRDNNLYLEDVRIDMSKNSYKATVFYPCDDYEQMWVEEIGEGEKIGVR